MVWHRLKKVPRKVWLPIVILSAALLFFYGAVSSYAICAVWLPWAGKFLPGQVSAEEVRVSFGWRALAVKARGLEYRDGRGTVLHAGTFGAGIPYCNLKRDGQYRVDYLRADDVSVSVIRQESEYTASNPEIAQMDKAPRDAGGEEASPEKNGGRSLPRITAGPVELNRVKLEYLTEESVRSLTVAHLSCGGFEQGKESSLEVTGSVTVRSRDFNLTDHPFCGKIRYIADGDYLPGQVSLETESHLPVEWAAVPGKVILRLEVKGVRETEHGFRLETLRILQDYEGKTEFTAGVAGKIDPWARTCDLTWMVRGQGMRMLALKFLKRNPWRPEGLLADLAGTFVHTDAGAVWRGGGRIAAEKVYYQNELYASGAALDWEQDLSYDRKGQSLCVRQLKGTASEQGTGAEVKLFSEGSLMVYPGRRSHPRLSFDTEHAKLHAEVRNLDATLIRPFLQGEECEGKLNFSADLHSDTTEQAHGGGWIHAELKAFKVRNLKRAATAELSMELSTENRFETVKIHEANLKVTRPDDGRTICGAVMKNGKYESKQGHLELDCVVNAQTQELEELWATPVPEQKLKRWTQALPELIASSRIVYELDSGLVQADAHVLIPEVCLPGRQGGEKLTVNLSAEREPGRIRLKDFRVRQNGIVELRCTGEGPNPLKLNWELRRADLSIAADWMRLAGMDESLAGLQKKFQAGKFTTGGSLEWRAGTKCLQVTDGMAELEFQNGGRLGFRILSPLEVCVDGMDGWRMNCGKAELKGEDGFDLCCLNPLFPRPEVFHFEAGHTGGRIEGKVSYRAGNLQLDFVPDASSKDLSLYVCGKSVPLAGAEVRGGKYSLSTRPGGMVFHGAKGTLEGGEAAEFEVNGELPFDSRRAARMEWKTGRVTHGTLAKVFPKILPESKVNAGYLSGDGVWIRRADRGGHEFRMRVQAHDFRSPLLAGQKPDQGIGGKLDADWAFEQNVWRLNRTDLCVKQKSGRPLALLSLTGDWNKESAALKLNGQGADLSAIQNLLTAKVEVPEQEQRKESVPPDPVAEKKSEEPEKSVLPDPVEPDAVDWHGFTGTLEIDLESLSYGPGAVFGVHGKLTDRNNVFKCESCVIQVNGTPLLLDLSVDHGKNGGYPYVGHLRGENLELSRVLPVFFPDLKEKKMALELESLQWTAWGKGFSSGSLGRNLNGSFQAELAKLELPVQSKEVSSLLEILFLPLETLPRLTELMPAGEFRKWLGKTLDRTQDILTGKANVSFDDGSVKLKAENGVLMFDKFAFQGDMIKSEIIKGRVNPFSGEVDIQTMTDFRLFRVPLNFTGNLHRKVSPDLSQFLLDFSKENTIGVFQQLIEDDPVGTGLELLDRFRKRRQKE